MTVAPTVAAVLLWSVDDGLPAGWRTGDEMYERIVRHPELDRAE